MVIPRKANLSSTWKNETLNGDYTYNGLTKDGDPHFKERYHKRFLNIYNYTYPKVYYPKSSGPIRHGPWPLLSPLVLESLSLYRYDIDDIEN